MNTTTDSKKLPFWEFYFALIYAIIENKKKEFNMDNFIKSKINRIIELNLKIYDYYQSLITLEETKDKHPDYEKRKKNISSFILELL